MLLSKHQALGYKSYPNIGQIWGTFCQEYQKTKANSNQIQGKRCCSQYCHFLLGSFDKICRFQALEETVKYQSLIAVNICRFFNMSLSCDNQMLSFCMNKVNFHNFWSKHSKFVLFHVFGSGFGLNYDGQKENWFLKYFPVLQVNTREFFQRKKMQQDISSFTGALTTLWTR